MPHYQEIIKKEKWSNLTFNEPLASYTSWRIGGSGEMYVAPADIHEIRDIVAFANAYQIPLTPLGGGSNVLLSDQGLKGIVLHVTHRLSAVKFLEKGQVSVQAGVRLGALVRKAVARNLGGIEGLWGIPGTIGGAVVMNAGACGVEFFDVLVSVTSVTPDGRVVTRHKSEINHEYRASDYKYNREVVLEAVIQLQEMDAAIIAQNLKDADERRKPQHNIRLPNAGSVFRNPPAHFAAKLIEGMGAKGRTYGNAQVSEHHANFIVNLGGARACDVRDLIHSLQEDILSTYGVSVEPEVLFVGEF